MTFDNIINDATETFDIFLTAEDFKEQLPALLNQPWLTKPLFEQTVLICTAKIMKVELKPYIPQIRGQGVFPETQRVTVLTHGIKS